MKLLSIPRGSLLRSRAKELTRLFQLPFLPEENFLILLSIVLGGLTGICSVGFIYLLRITHRLFFPPLPPGWIFSVLLR